MVENQLTSVVAKFAEEHGFEFYQGSDAPEKIRNYQKGDKMLHFIAHSNDPYTGMWRLINEGFAHPVSHGGAGVKELTEWLESAVLPEV